MDLLELFEAIYKPAEQMGVSSLPMWMESGIGLGRSPVEIQIDKGRAPALSEIV